MFVKQIIRSKFPGLKAMKQGEEQVAGGGGGGEKKPVGTIVVQPDSL